MNLSFFQIILGLISSAVVVNGTLKFLKKSQGQTFFKFFATVCVWGSIFGLAIFPRVSHIISEKIGLGENLNTLIFIGFVAVFGIIFKLINIIERTERNISKIVRREALSKLNDQGQ